MATLSSRMCRDGAAIDLERRQAAWLPMAGHGAATMSDANRVSAAREIPVICTASATDRRPKLS
jgi:hypothetical protein